MSIRVRAVEAADLVPWSTLYAGYREFYRLDDDPEKVRTTWEWVSTGALGMQGLVAVDENDALVGLANLRWFARPSTATVGLYLDDLFTSPAARGTGAGTALLREAAAIAADAGASVVRWITASDNATARSLYDRHATATPWVTYDMAPAAR
ncbi:GNAT family N-acetyltransferase [Microbacterium sp. ASV49]|uniref:GNAT family N-acetyltransferase n=1 Tax=Microbacterium candidum TaxID=3041922 RepID=A0ABT7N388_9MICO|nr:GNAT family N-acetyltransferase [Microbacterium sp. ASV49]MDL9981169.1 GNAT family N-acetyltransferase [Microbacterium sp. ASV49]